MSRPTKNKLLLSAVAIAVIAGGFATVQVFNNSDASAQMAGGEMPPMPVPVITVEQKPVQIWKNFSARLAAVDYVEIRPQVSGLIEKIHFQDGQIVKAGDMLYTIDPRPYAAAVAQAKADLAATNNDVVYTKQELERAEELIKTGALSKQVYDQRINAQKSANSAVAAAAARVKSAQVDLDNASIKAPITGRISRAEITQGNLVNAAAAPLLTTIVADKEIYADFEVDEQTYLKYIRQNSSQSVESEQGIPVRMKMADDAKYYDGKIKSFDNKINPSSGTIRARAVFANDDSALLPGMFTSVQLGSASEESRISITEKAVGTDQNRKFVYTVGEGNTVAYNEVTLGDSSEGNRVILTGLKPGEKVIIDGLMKIRPGMKIDPKTPEEIEKIKAQTLSAGVQQAAPAEAATAETPAATTEEPAAATPAKEPAVEETPASAEPVPLEEPATAEKPKLRIEPVPETSDLLAPSPAQE